MGQIGTRGSQRLRSQEEEDLRRRLRLFEEEVSGGRVCLGFPVVHRRKRSRSTIELSCGVTRRRRNPMARRLFRFGAPANSCDGGKRRWLCVDWATKLRRATRGGRIIQIIARVLLCFLSARPEQPRRSVCGPWAMCLIWASAGFFCCPCLSWVLWVLSEWSWASAVG